MPAMPVRHSECRMGSPSRLRFSSRGVVVPGGIVTTVVGADVWIAKSAFRVINPQISGTIRVAKEALWPRFVDVAARNISFCRVSRHGQNCSRYHRENAEQGVAGLVHSPLRSIQSSRVWFKVSPDRTRSRLLAAK